MRNKVLMLLVVFAAVGTVSYLAFAGPGDGEDGSRDITANAPGDGNDGDHD